ncbi:MAG: hypothetical protein EHM41_24620 [Chloroflexi bacterium]|nr:MAG: hypothetical protein EHM41_24620 [Chloroflexota bacterium]
MNRLLQNFRSLVVGLYAWIATVFFGLILLDIVYAKLLRAVPGAVEVTTVFSEVADILLMAGFFMDVRHCKEPLDSKSYRCPSRVYNPHFPLPVLSDHRCFQYRSLAKNHTQWISIDFGIGGVI